MPGPAPMPGKILVGDEVKLKDAKLRPYVQQYGRALESKKWEVIAQDFIGGRRRLTVNDVPSMIWASDAKLAYKPQATERRERLCARGVKLP